MSLHFDTYCVKQQTIHLREKLLVVSVHKFSFNSWAIIYPIQSADLCKMLRGLQHVDNHIFQDFALTKTEWKPIPITMTLIIIWTNLQLDPNDLTVWLQHYANRCPHLCDTDTTFLSVLVLSHHPVVLRHELTVQTSQSESECPQWHQATSEPFLVPWCCSSCWLWTDSAHVFWIECHVHCIFQPLIGGLDVAPVEVQGLVGFICCKVVPTEVRGDLYPKVFCLLFCATGMAMELEL